MCFLFIGVFPVCTPLCAGVRAPEMELPCERWGLNLEPLEEQWPQLLSHLSFLSQTVFVVPNCPSLSCPQEPCKDMVPAMPLDRTLCPQCLGSASLGELGHYKAFTSVSSQLITLPGIRTRNRTGEGPPHPLCAPLPTIHQSPKNKEAVVRMPASLRHQLQFCLPPALHPLLSESITAPMAQARHNMASLTPLSLSVHSHLLPQLVL